jgi:hypothetical protein
MTPLCYLVCFQATTVQSSGDETSGTTKRTSGANLKYDYVHDL